MYKPKHFILEELVDKRTFESTPEWKLWYALDERILKIADLVREEIGPITINNWKWNGNRQWSQHSFGRALDMVPKLVTPRQGRDKIKEMMEKGKFKGITNSITCEETKSYRDHKKDPLTWIHLDVRNNQEGYNEFYI